MAKVLVKYGDEVNHTASCLADDHSDPRQLDRHQLLEVTKHPNDGTNNRYTITSEINGAAFDGNGRAQGLAGDQ
ncbi:hypothetical protein ACFWA5_22290 [Streptomyces mirabilis]|uniref:hypothetical protein n=1 Tax=Streptomyces mirabilis TaxID=68239 RepID=UPI00364E7279